MHKKIFVGQKVRKPDSMQEGIVVEIVNDFYLNVKFKDKIEAWWPSDRLLFFDIRNSVLNLFNEINVIKTNTNLNVYQSKDLLQILDYIYCLRALLRGSEDIKSLLNKITYDKIS